MLCPFERTNYSDACVLKFVISANESFVNFLVIVVYESEWKALNPFLIGNFNDQETLVVMFKWKANSFSIIHDSIFFQLCFVQTVKAVLQLVACVKGELIIPLLIWVLDIISLIAYRSEVLRLLNVSDLSHVSCTAGSEIRIHHDRVIIICLSVQCDDLDSTNQQLQKFIIVTVNWRPLWIWS